MRGFDLRRSRASPLVLFISQNVITDSAISVMMPYTSRLTTYWNIPPHPLGAPYPEQVPGVYRATGDGDINASPAPGAPGTRMGPAEAGPIPSSQCDAIDREALAHQVDAVPLFDVPSVTSLRRVVLEAGNGVGPHSTRVETLIQRDEHDLVGQDVLTLVEVLLDQCLVHRAVHQVTQLGKARGVLVDHIRRALVEPSRIRSGHLRRTPAIRVLTVRRRCLRVPHVVDTDQTGKAGGPDPGEFAAVCGAEVERLTEEQRAVLQLSLVQDSDCRQVLREQLGQLGAGVVVRRRREDRLGRVGYTVHAGLCTKVGDGLDF